MVRVGLTGSIGSGKTLVGKIFQVLGIPVFQADEEARKLYRLPEVIQRVSIIAGQDITGPDGEVDRKLLAGILFSDRLKLQKVNDLIHPLVREAFMQRSGQLPGTPYILYEAAILIETGHYREMDRLIVVQAPEAVRIQRVMDRDGAAKEEVWMRMEHQMPDEDRSRFADFIIYNDGSRLVIPQVLEIDQALRAI